MIKHVAFFIFPVTDMARSRQFYEEVLGLKYAGSFMDQGNWVEYDINGVTLGISDRLPAPSGSGGGIAFEVDDLDAEVKRLTDLGVNWLFPPFESPICRGAVFSDPDGNTIGLHQFKAGQDASNESA